LVSGMNLTWKGGDEIGREGVLGGMGGILCGKYIDIPA